MIRTHREPESEIAGIDLGFRPGSYFWPLDLETHLLARVKREERRVALKRLIDGGRLDEIPDFLSQSALSRADREALGRLHPDFLGGEYLPDLAPNEVMIARITIASTTQDVVCVYARRGRSRIHYRVVDEYAGDTLSGRNARTSVAPLTLGELEAFFNGAWSLFTALSANFGDEGDDLKGMLRFVRRIESEFYPQIDELYRRRIEIWSAALRSARTPVVAREAADGR